MIPIKILCGCGQRYAFDVDPVRGVIGYAVQCPVCGADGTAAANQVITQHLAARTASAPRLQLDGQKPPPEVQTPPRRNLRDAVQARNSSGAKVRNKWLVPAICSGAVGLVLVVLFGRSHGREHEALSAAAVARDDVPRTLAELNAWYVEPPAGQNAATFYLRGFNALHIGDAGSSNVPLLGKGKLPPLGAPMSASMKSALTALVRSNGDALQFFAQGAKHEQNRYPVDLTLGLDALFPHVPKLKNAVLLVELAAIFHAEANDGKQAGNDVLIALALARSLEAEPALLSQLIRAASVSVAVTALERTMNRVVLPQESLSDLFKALQKMENYDARGEGFNRGMAAERATSMALLETPQKLLQALAVPGVNIPADERDQMTALLQKGDKPKEELQFFENTFGQIMTAREEAFPDRLKTDGVIRQRVTEAARKKLAIMGVLLPGLEGRTAREAQCLADLRLGLTAVALERFRAAHDNQYPAALSELAPDYLTAPSADPFDGRPLRYRKKDAGYVLYSIGPDLKDDSGKPMSGKEGDIVFSVITPAKSAK